MNGYSSEMTEICERVGDRMNQQLAAMLTEILSALFLSLRLCSSRIWRWDSMIHSFDLYFQEIARVMGMAFLIEASDKDDVKTLLVFPI